jgi:uncharacterized protein (TIGR02453 family)
MSRETYFSSALFKLLRELAQNNRRDWFQANKSRYEESIRHPAQRFIVDFGARLQKISPHFTADPRPVGGSLFRIHRDVRFSKDKSPYKTHVGIHFPHRAKKSPHVPGFYLHLDPKNVFVGVGIWHPDGPTLKKIRDAIVAKPADWKRVRDDKRFRARFDLGGESLKRPPRGYDPEHRYVEDLKRKDFVGFASISQKDVTSPRFLDAFVEHCRAGSPYVRWLCRAIGLPFSARE